MKLQNPRWQGYKVIKLFPRCDHARHDWTAALALRLFLNLHLHATPHPLAYLICRFIRRAAYLQESCINLEGRWCVLCMLIEMQRRLAIADVATTAVLAMRQTVYECQSRNQGLSHCLRH